MMHLKRIALPAGFAALAISQAAAQPAAPVPVARNGEKPRNVIFILSDDHRYDFMGFTGAVPWLQTPALDRYFEDKEFSPREDRSGFPALIKEELLAIHVYSLRHRSKKQPRA